MGAPLPPGRLWLENELGNGRGACPSPCAGEDEVDEEEEALPWLSCES